MDVEAAKDVGVAWEAEAATAEAEVVVIAVDVAKKKMKVHATKNAPCRSTESLRRSRVAAGCRSVPW